MSAFYDDDSDSALSSGTLQGTDSASQMEPTKPPKPSEQLPIQATSGKGYI